MLSSGLSPICPHFSSSVVPRTGHNTPAEAMPVQSRKKYLPGLRYDTPVNTPRMEFAFSQMHHIVGSYSIYDLL